MWQSIKHMYRCHWKQFKAPLGPNGHASKRFKNQCPLKGAVADGGHVKINWSCTNPLGTARPMPDHTG